MTRLNGVLSNAIPSWEDEFRLLLRDGRYGTVMDRGYVIKDNVGNPVRAIGALVNITEQKLLIREMEILSLIVRESNNSVIIFDRQSKKIAWVNAGLIRCTGYTRQELLTSDISRVMEEMGADEGILTHICLQMQADRPFCCELMIRTKGGENRWQSVTGQPIRGFDHYACSYFVIATDISDRRKAEVESLASKIDRQKEATRIILQTQEKERNALGRELHDNINQILAAVNLKLGFYLEEPENNIDVVRDCRQDLERAIQETRRLSHHMVMPRFSEINLKDELELLFGSYTIHKSVQFKCEIANEARIPAHIKETIFRIAQEQLSNIIKHARATKIDVQMRVEQDKVVLAIHDNGVGFDVHRSANGIGIANIYSRVESYNGVAAIRSTPGKGCTLSLFIPLAAKTPG